VPEVKRQLAQLEADGKIRVSSSPFSHPLVVVAKKSGELRICTDLRYVNSGTIPDAYPMPNPDELIDRIARASFVSLIDATAGYFNIPLRSDHCYRYAFNACGTLYEWCVLPFGAAYASSTFMRAMDSILRPHRDYADAFVDDVSIYSMSWLEHLTHLRKVLQSFKDSGMTLRLSKCVFAQSHVQFLGHTVGQNTRSVIHDRVTAIQQIPEPSTKRQLRQVLGVIGFYRQYIHHYSEIAHALTEMTKKDRPNSIRFNDTQRAAFISLKKALCEACTLHTPDINKPFVLRTDASDKSLSGALTQKDEEGFERPVAFMSAKLTPTQARYAIIEREALAVIMCLKRWDYLLYGAFIDLYCDHNPLAFVITGSSDSAKLTRWSLALSRYNITFHHIPGKDNIVADYLSRCM
jgi:hypothetical protein